MMPPTNTAAWLTAAKARPLEIKSAPYTSPRQGELVVKNSAVAINPLDYAKQDMGDFLFSWTKYPFILGSDVAGEVVEVGPGVNRFKAGDRVLAHAAGMDEKLNRAAESGFQTYTIALANMTAQIPDGLSYESASVLPLGLSTAACGLFQKDQLALQYPTVPPKPTGKTLLVWGGSTSVGCNAIQLAVAAGYEVITTASPKNFDYVKSLGASQAFNYKTATIIDDLIRAFKGKTTAGAISIGKGAAEACMDILDKCTGDKFIAMATYPLPDPAPKRFVVLQTVLYYISWNVTHWLKSKSRHIGYKYIFGTTLVHNEVGKAIYEDFLPKALEEGVYIAAPEPQVFGKGLEQIQGAMDLQKKGVSAKKIVVSL